MAGKRKRAAAAQPSGQAHPHPHPHPHPPAEGGTSHKHARTEGDSTIVHILQQLDEHTKQTSALVGKLRSLLDSRAEGAGTTRELFAIKAQEDVAGSANADIDVGRPASISSSSVAATAPYPEPTTTGSPLALETTAKPKPSKDVLLHIEDKGGRVPWKVQSLCQNARLVPPSEVKAVKVKDVIVRDYAIGLGCPVKLGRMVSVTYIGMFPSGQIFDRNEKTKSPFQFRLGAGEVVRGLEIGVAGMNEGGCREIAIPPKLGYGIEGIPGKIPPHQTLIFRIQLIKAGR